MRKTDFDRAYSDGLLSEESYGKLKTNESSGLFSIGFEVKTLLYAGVILLAGGFGIAIYNNIDSIGHMAVIALIAGASFASFYYCFRKSVPYSNEKIVSPGILFDYILLFGSLTLVSFIGYLQYQYSVFGTITGLTFLIPSILLIAAAYYFDHLGVLSMSITLFAAFAGITISPLSLMNGSNFSFQSLIYTGITIGIILILTGGFLSQRNIKKHFTLTYYHFGAHLLFLFILTGLMGIDNILFVIPLALFTFLVIRYAQNTHSFYFIFIAIIYGYIGLTYLFFKLIFLMNLNLFGVYPVFGYFIFSSIFIIKYLKIYRNKIRSYDYL